MVIKVTRWSPDTCKCVLEYQWDDSEPESSRTHSLYNVVSKCGEHAGLADDITVYNTVGEENPRKNMTIKEILEAGISDITEVDAESGRLVFKKGITVTWSWSGTPPNRVLNITVQGITLTANQRNTIQNKLNTRFGAGKVILL